MKNMFSSSKEAIHDYLVQHTRVMARCAASFVGGFDFADIEVVEDCISGCTAVVQEGNIRKTMAARGLVNGRSRAISESSGGCSQRTAKWEGFSFPLLSS